jgi:cystathionine gamma-lyase
MLSDRELFESLRFSQNAIGAIQSPFDSYMVLRGSKTLQVRMQRHSENAQKVAEFLSRSSAFGQVNYPGLRSHPQYPLARKQMLLPGGMLSAEVSGGLRSAKRFLSRLRVFSLAESLGGVESLVEHPATMTHASIPKKRREAVGISDGLLRFSVGIEEPEDLISDLRRALR